MVAGFLLKVMIFPPAAPDFRVFQLLRLLRWVKFISLTGVEEFFGSVFNLGFRGRNILKMVKLVFYISISAHIGGCLWFYMAAINNFGTNTWTHAYGEGNPSLKLCGIDSCLFSPGVNNSSILSKYLSSVYWAFATVTTVSALASCNMNSLFTLSINALCICVGGWAGGIR